MYQVPVLDPQIPRDYAINYSNKLQPIIQSFLNGATIPITVKNRGNVTVGVQRNTPTYRLLTKLLDVANLQQYLLWSPLQQFGYIKKLSNLKSYPQDFIFNKLWAYIYDQENVAQMQQPIDHFNTIFHHIFVEQIYDSKAIPAPFDKWDFIVKTQLRVCPYCGMEIIQPAGGTKQQIDHFFPKSKYPFLALSYYNLIPSCNMCNESPNKAAKDPIEKSGSGKAIQHPYLMNSNLVRFNIRLNSTNIYSDDSFDVIVGYSQKALLDGNNLFFHISERYRSRNIEGAPYYRRIVNYQSAKGFYAGMPIDNQWLDQAYNDAYSFAPENNKPWRQEYFKMKLDLFEQLYCLRPAAPFYTDRSTPNTEVLE